MAREEDSMLYGVNGRGHAVGQLTPGNGLSWNGKAFRPLTLQDGLEFGIVLGINDDDVMVGYGTDVLGTAVAIKREADGTMVDLGSQISNPTGWRLTGMAAYDISNTGYIIGAGYYDDGTGPDWRGFLLKPLN